MTFKVSDNQYGRSHPNYSWDSCPAIALVMAAQSVIITIQNCT